MSNYQARSRLIGNCKIMFSSKHGSVGLPSRVEVIVPYASWDEVFRAESDGVSTMTIKADLSTCFVEVSKGKIYTKVWYSKLARVETALSCNVHFEEKIEGKWTIRNIEVDYEDVKDYGIEYLKDTLE